MTDNQGYNIFGANIVKDNDCLKCGLCIAVCPKKALHHDEAE